MSTTRMMILGLVSWLQPVHGDEVRRELLSWRADEWANIHPGSIYHARSSSGRRSRAAGPPSAGRRT